MTIWKKLDIIIVFFILFLAVSANTVYFLSTCKIGIEAKAIYIKNEFMLICQNYYDQQNLIIVYIKRY